MTTLAQAVKEVEAFVGMGPLGEMLYVRTLQLQRGMVLQMLKQHARNQTDLRDIEDLSKIIHIEGTW